MSGAKKLRAERESEAHGGFGENETADAKFGHKPKDLLLSVKFLFKNPVFDLLILVGCLEYALISGFVVFLPKVIQFQFAQTPTMSAIWAGI